MTESEVISLKEFVLTLMENYQKAHDREHELIADALLKASQTMEVRMDALNKLRTDVLTDRGQYITRSIADERFGMLSAQQNRLERNSDQLKGQIVGIIGGVSIAFALLNILLAYVLK